MSANDLVITPFFLGMFLVFAYLARPFVSNRETKKYFFPALLLKFLGAISLGLLYQFYYGGGDTFNYFEQSEWIQKAFAKDPYLGFSILLEEGGVRVPHTYEFTNQIWYYKDPSSFFIVKLVAFFNLFTFQTYSSTALFFALFGFSGLWALFSVLQKKYVFPNKRLFAFGVLFFPSIVFWGSGILKDSISLGAVCWMTWSIIRWIDFKKRGVIEFLALLTSFWLLYVIKVYILICLVPAIGAWLLFKNLYLIRTTIAKWALFPLFFIVFLGGGYFGLVQLTEQNEIYRLDNLAERSRITAYDIRYGWGARTGGDGGYDIGLPDGSWFGMIKLIPSAISVTLFRPYIWEVKNPLMLLSSLEAILIILLSVRFISKRKRRTFLRDPFLIFCLSFTLLFAFAVGASSFNFGTLMRYKIPMLPFYLIFLSAPQKKIEESQR